MKTLTCLSLPAVLALAVAAADPTGAGQEKRSYPKFGTVERLDPAFDKLIPPGAVLEDLVGGHDWAEGPVWVPRDGGYLLFSDIPRNSIYKWQEGKGESLFLKPSGYTGSDTHVSVLTVNAPPARVACSGR